jgi:hypothetical protein
MFRLEPLPDRATVPHFRSAHTAIEWGSIRGMIGVILS